MSKNTLILSAAALALVGAFAFRAQSSTASKQLVPSSRSNAVSQNVPRMVELGADSCASCKAMFPVLDTLRQRHGKELQVDFIDVWKFPEQAKSFHVKVIPTQVFFNANGTELARHQGFFPTNEIEKKWAQLGVHFSSSKFGSSKNAETNKAGK